MSECPNCFVIVDTTEKTLQIYKGVEPQTIPGGREDAALEGALSARWRPAKKNRLPASTSCAGQLLPERTRNAGIVPLRFRLENRSAVLRLAENLSTTASSLFQFLSFETQLPTSDPFAK